MKRRKFLQSAAAAVAAPTLPTSLFAGSTTLNGAVYKKAIYYSRLWGNSVPEMYTSALGLNLDQANALFGKLVSNKVLASPNASGIAQAVSPFYKVTSLAETVSNAVTKSANRGLSSNPIKPKNTTLDEVIEKAVEPKSPNISGENEKAVESNCTNKNANDFADPQTEEPSEQITKTEITPFRQS